MTLINIRQLFSCFGKLNTTDVLWHWSMFDTYTMRDLHTNLMYVYKIQHKHYSLCSERYSQYHQNIQDNRRRLLHAWVESEIFPITCFLLIKYRIITSLCMERKKRRQTMICNIYWNSKPNPPPFHVPLVVVNTSRSFPHSWLINGFVSKLTRRVPLVEQVLPTLPEHLSSTTGFGWGSCWSVFSFMCLFYISLFVLLYFFFWSLCCLFVFDMRILIAPLVS
jgi:hypothetical protein